MGSQMVVILIDTDLVPVGVPLFWLQMNHKSKQNDPP